MKNIIPPRWAHQSGLALLSAALALPAFAQQPTAADPRWPRVFNQGSRRLTAYQPQVVYWHGYRTAGD